MTTGRDAADPEIAARRAWMSVLAKAPSDAVADAWAATDPKPDYTVLRGPETGLAMIQARVGGTGRRFSFGEMTLSRCVVQLRDGRSGFGFVAGSDARHAEYAAVFDAMLQDARQRGALEKRVIDPIRDLLDERRRAADARSAATRVEFFTQVRGEDE